MKRLAAWPGLISRYFMIKRRWARLPADYTGRPEAATKKRLEILESGGLAPLWPVPPCHSSANQPVGCEAISRPEDCGERRPKRCQASALQILATVGLDAQGLTDSKPTFVESLSDNDAVDAAFTDSVKPPQVIKGGNAA